MGQTKKINELEGRIKTRESDIEASKKNLQNFVDAHLIKYDSEFKTRKNFLGYAVYMRATVLSVNRSFSAFIRALESNDIPPERMDDYIKSQQQTLDKVAKLLTRAGEEYNQAVVKMLERSKARPEYPILAAGFSESLLPDAIVPDLAFDSREPVIRGKAKTVVALCGQAENVLDKHVRVLEEVIGQYRSAFVRRCVGQDESGESVIA